MRQAEDGHWSCWQIGYEGGAVSRVSGWVPTNGERPAASRQGAQPFCSVVKPALAAGAAAAAAATGDTRGHPSPLPVLSGAYLSSHSGRVGKCLRTGRFCSVLWSPRDFGWVSPPRGAPATDECPQPRTFCLRFSHPCLFSSWPCGPSVQCSVGALQRSWWLLQQSARDPWGVWGQKPRAQGCLSGSRQQGLGWLQVTQTAAKLGASGLPVATRPYKEQLWEARDIPGNCLTIRHKSSSAKIWIVG